MQENFFHQTNPFIVPTEDGKSIFEHFGITSTQDTHISIAHMIAPAGWSEPKQTPEFGEYTLMVRGKKQITAGENTIVLHAGESIYIPAGSTVQYSNPFSEEAEYWSVCMPAFSPKTVHRAT